MSSLERHYEESKKHYKEKYPENYKELKRLKLEKELREAKKTKISSAIDSICRELDALNNTCWKCIKEYDELYGDAFCPNCLTHQ